MTRIIVETKEKIGQITKIVSNAYEIPQQIRHNKDGQIMTWNSYHRRYVCITCGEQISGEEFILSELEKQKNAEIENEM